MTDPRIAVLSALSSPGWHPVPEAHGMPWGEAEELLAAYDASRAAVGPSAPADRAALAAEAAIERVRSVLESEAVVGRSALDYRGLITTALMADAASCPGRVAGEAQQPKICELPHLTIAEEDACEQHRLGVEAQQPETQTFVCKCPAEICHCGHHAAVSQPGKEPTQ